MSYQTLQGALQQAIRTGFGGANDFNGDLHTMCKFYGVPEAPISGRLISAAQKFDTSITTASAALNYFLQNYASVVPTLGLDFTTATSLDPRITFSRGSQATLFDSTGTLRFAKHNLVLQSEDLSTTWTTAASSITTNAAVAPDGNLTADKVVANSTSAFHGVNQSIAVISGFTYTFSVYAKASGYNFLRTGFASSRFGTAVAYFDLANGTIGTLSGVTATITPAGNGWYRCSMTATCTSSGTSTHSLIYTCQSDNQGAFTGDDTSGLFAWGAQLNLANMEGGVTPSLTTYYPTTTAAYYAPRFDYNPSTLAPLGLLIEEQRANLLLQSEDFATTWTATRASITTNTIVAPSGALTGDKLVEDTTASNTHFVTQNITASATGSYTYSIFAKKDERYTLVVARNTSNITSFAHTFDLQAGTASGGGVIASVGNGWYRCSGTVTVESTGSSGVQFRLSDGSSSTYTGNGTSGIFIWGAQLEAGAFATSYIPTTTTALTRNADVASMTGTNFSSWYNAAEGTFVSDVVFGAGVATNTGIVSAYESANPTNNRISVRIGNTIITSGGTQVANFFPAASANSVGKWATAYKTDSFALSVNGAAPSTDTSGAAPTSINELEIGGVEGSSDLQLNGTIRRIAYYPVRLANAQLQALTA